MILLKHDCWLVVKPTIFVDRMPTKLSAVRVVNW